MLITWLVDRAGSDTAEVVLLHRKGNSPECSGGKKCDEAIPGSPMSRDTGAGGATLQRKTRRPTVQAASTSSSAAFIRALLVVKSLNGEIGVGRSSGLPPDAISLTRWLA